METLSFGLQTLVRRLNLRPSEGPPQVSILYWVGFTKGGVETGVSNPGAGHKTETTRSQQGRYFTRVVFIEGLS